MTNELTGTVKALLEEYKKAIHELIVVIEPLSDDEIKMRRDDKTNDPNCTSIQTILTHVVYAGYVYTIFIENHMGYHKERRPKQYFETSQEYIKELNDMFDYCKNFFIHHSIVQLQEEDHLKKITTNWGQQFDIEQLMEHAIVHVLKHRRQIANFIAQKAKSQHTANG